MYWRRFIKICVYTLLIAYNLSSSFTHIFGRFAYLYIKLTFRVRKNRVYESNKKYRVDVRARARSKREVYAMHDREIGKLLNGLPHRQTRTHTCTAKERDAPTITLFLVVQLAAILMLWKRSV